MPLTKNSKRWSLLLLGLTIGAIILLAAGFSTFELQPGRPFPYRLLFGQAEAPAAAGSVVAIPASFLEILTLAGLVVTVLILLLWLITFILRPQSRKRMLRRLATYFILLLLLHGLLGIVREMEPVNDEADQANVEAFSEPAPPLAEAPTPPAFVIDPPGWLSTLITAGIVGLFLGGLWLMWLRRQPRLSPQRRARAEPLPQLVQEARQTIDALQRGDDLKNSILGCYRAMSRVLKEERGLERQKMMTARDFEQHLAELGLRDGHIRQLTRLFEKFRYSPAEPTAQDEAVAIDCLNAIVETYGRPA